MARRRPSRLSRIAQSDLLALLARGIAPLLLALALWFAAQFDGMRFEIQKLADGQATTHQWLDALQKQFNEIKARR